MARRRYWLPLAMSGLLLAMLVLDAGHPPLQAAPPKPVPPRSHAGPVFEENKKPGSHSWHSPELKAGRGQSVDEDSHERDNKKSKPKKPGGPASLSEVFANEITSAVDTVSAAAQTPVWTDTVIRGYFDQQSVNAGQSIRLFVSTAQPSFNVDLYRMGWYGGAGARLIASYTGLPGQNQPVPTPDPSTGLIAANWQPSLTITTGTTWLSGVYLAKLTASSGDAGYALFVVRNDGAQADILYEVPFATYQAYNNWGGKSLYDFSSTNSIPAVKVSFDRPYAAWAGAGSFFDGDYNMILWLEQQGYNVTYVTSIDIQTNPAILNGRKVFLSPWHDEYWSKGMRDNLTAAFNRGMNLLFLGANAIYWQIRWENSASGAANRVIVCYKDATTDPLAKTQPALTTVAWRDPPVNQPESALLGEQFNGYFNYGTSYPWVVQNANHWLYSATGLQNNQTIPGLVGYEYDNTAGGTVAGATQLSLSPVTNLANVDTGEPDTASATIYRASSGAWVFDAGTIYWSWKLDDNTYQVHG
ncbi:MAG TPA: N,N-dimethylformamidase beta subunit family domain-containing protein, partial [Chloroflexota bacterium]|nr:N,N-dimethylformamidase beta subunit family domain-containing protein [Chloroflexota bacterium]